MPFEERVEMSKLILGDETYAVIGAAIEVHRELGPGFLEKVYHEALQLELGARSIPYEVEKPIGIEYKGQRLSQRYLADLVCYEKIVVELKALKQLSGREDSQLLNYLRATGLRVGLLLNFGGSSTLEHRRLVV